MQKTTRRRKALALALVASLVSPIALASSQSLAETRVLLGVDRDDDDRNGKPDLEQEVLSTASDLHSFAFLQGEERRIRPPGDIVRVLVDGRPLTTETRVDKGAKRLELQAKAEGRAVVRVGNRDIAVSAIGVVALDGAGNIVDATRSHASMERTPPERLGADPYAKSKDPDAVRLVLIGLPDDLPPLIRVFARAPSGEVLDVLSDVPLGSVPCPSGTKEGLACGSTKPIRAVPDEIDRDHPLVRDRSIRAMLGGSLEVYLPGQTQKLGGLRVAGPRESAIGPIERHKAHLRVLLVRVRKGGPAPIGGDDKGAIALAREEVMRASALWGACGIGFGSSESLDIAIVDPPKPHLVALGCDHGLPASGGKLRVRVDGREISANVEKGTTPRGAARVLGAALMATGLSVQISDNPTIWAGARGSSDLLVRKKSGEPALVEPPLAGPISSDSTLTACIGRVELEDGLQHFVDIDAIAGTLEERALIKAFDDGDPTTIEVIVVPSFASGGRIGESFIGADGGAIRNVLIEDRAAFRADRASFALAHELGHILLDEPGHPDDFGRDTPTRLMDADAANGTAYGPRRLLVEECVRALRQSGPDAPTPLLQPWPLLPIGKER